MVQTSSRLVRTLANKLNDRASVATGRVDARETRERRRLSPPQPPGFLLCDWLSEQRLPVTTPQALRSTESPPRMVPSLQNNVKVHLGGAIANILCFPTIKIFQIFAVAWCALFHSGCFKVSTLMSLLSTFRIPAFGSNNWMTIVA